LAKAASARKTTSLLLALDLRDQQFLPAFGAVDVARPQLDRQAVALPIEQQQGVITVDSKWPL